jgi:hypothetical protein
MASSGKITDLFDVEGIKDQYDQVMGFVNKYVQQVEEASAIRLKVEESKSVRDRSQAISDLANSVKKYQAAADATVASGQKLMDTVAGIDKTNTKVVESQKNVNKSLSDLVLSTKDANQSYQELLELSVKNEIAQKELAASKKALNDEFKNGNISQDDYLKALTSIKDQQVDLSNQQRDLTTSLRNLAKEAGNAETSLDSMKARLALLQQAYSKLSDEEKKSPIGKEIEKETRKLSDSINTQKKSIGDFSSNVGRYTESLGSGFENVRREIQRLQKESDNLRISGDTRGVEAAGRAINELDNIIKVSYDSTKTYQQTVRSLEQEYKNLAASGSQSEEFLKEFQKFVAQAKHESGELTQSIKALSSETRGLDLFTGSISTIASTFETAAGASALFGANTEGTEKTLQKLVAIQSVANGLREIGRNLTEKESAAGKAYAFVQKQIAIATDSSAGATARWGAALKAIGIGLLVSAVAYLVDKLDLFGSESEDAAEASKDLTEAIKSQNEAIQQNIELIERDYDEGLKNLQKQYDLAQASGKDQLTLFALKKQIAEKEKKLADDQLAAQVKFADSLSGTITNGKRGLEGLVIAQSKYKERVVQINGQIEEAEQRKYQAISDGNKEVQKDIQDFIDSLKAQKDEANNSYSAITNSINGAADAAENLSKIQAEEAKFRADERRKLILETARIETQTIIDANERILSNEKSTLAQRLLAVDEIAKAQKKAAEAQKQAILSDPSKIGTAEYSLAIKNFNASANKITVESQKQKEEIIAQFRIRDLQAEEQYQNQVLGLYIETNQKLADNNKLSLEQRLQARARYIQAQTQQINNEFKLQLQQAGISDEEISALEKDRGYRVKSAKLTAEEIEAIQIDHETKLATIVSAGASAITSILESELDKQAKIRDASLADIQRAASFSGVNNTKQYADDIIALNKSLKDKKISIEAYNKERRAIDRKYQLISLNDAIDSFQRQLNLLDGAEGAEITAKRNLEDAKRALEQATTDEAKKQAIDRVAIAEKEYEDTKAITDKKKKLEEDLAKAKAQISDESKANTTEDAKTQLEQLQTYIQAVGSTLSNALQSFAEIQGIFYDREIASIDSAIEALNKKKDKDTEVVNQTITNEQDKQKALAEINGRAEAEQAALEKRKRQAEIERARFEKAKNIADIISSTALAVVNALKSDDVPVALRIPLAISIGALGAAQLARAIAAPLPRFFRGKNMAEKDDYEGYAWVDDEQYGRGGKPETIIRESGKVEKGGYKPRITWIGKKDIVVPAGEEVPEKPSLVRRALAKVIPMKPRTAGAEKPKENAPVAEVLPIKHHRTIQLPDSETANRIIVNEIHRRNEAQAAMLTYPMFDDSNIVREIRKMRNDIIQSIRDGEKVNLNITETGLAAMIQHGMKTTKYINDQTNWNK